MRLKKFFITFFLLLCSCITLFNPANAVNSEPDISGSESKIIQTRFHKWKPEFLEDGKSLNSQKEMQKKFNMLLALFPYPGRKAQKKTDEINGIITAKNGEVKIDLDGVKGVRIICPVKSNWVSADSVEFDITLDAGFPDMIQTMVYLKDGDYCWYEAKLLRKAVAGATVRFTAPLRNFELWRNVGHGKTMNGYSLLEIREFGVGLFCEEKMTGRISVGNFTVIPRSGYEDPLCIIEFREPLRKVGQYEMFEAQFLINRIFDNPFDPEQVDVRAEITSPSGVVWKVDGFFTQDFSRKEIYSREQLVACAPYWAIRIFPRESGIHTYQLSVTTPVERCVMQPRDFYVTPSKNKGYISVSKSDPVFWEFENGDIFFPVGHSVHASYDEHYHTMQKMPKPVHDPKTFLYDKAFQKMGENGENFTEIWMCPWWMELEWRKEWHPYKGLGRYNLENAWRLDYLFNLAEQYGIYLQIALMNHGELSYTNSDPDWQNSPFFTENGGFLQRPEEFFKSERAQKLWRQKLRYIVARWGGSPNLFGWVLVSESDLIGPYSGWSKRAKEYFEWCIATSKYLKTIEPVPHPVTNHYYGNYSHLDKNLFRQPEINYMAADAYREGSHLIDQLIGTVGLQEQIKKPIIVSEYGGDWCGATDNNLKAEQHGGIWAAYMIGMTSTPLFWWFEFVEQHDLYGTYKGFSRFIAGEDRRGKPATTKRLKAVLPKNTGDDLNCLARVGDGWCDAWIFEEKGLPYISYWESKEAFYAPKKTYEKPWEFKTFSNATATIAGFAPGIYTAEYWDTLSGEVAAKEDITVGDDRNLVLKPPVFTRDIAVKVRRKK